MDEAVKQQESKKWRWGESLVLQKPNLRILWLTLIFLAGFLIMGELFFRLDAVQDRLTGLRIGSRHHQFEIQLGRLDKLVREGTPIDCIFLGNSMVWLGVDPLVVNRSFQEKTGQEIHCFNFGVSALPASSAGQIARMLVERYHPKVLVYGTFARDYAIPANVEDASAVSDTPWLKYQNGEFSLTGWLYAHSSIYQYKGHMRDFLLNNYLEDVFVQKDAPAYYAYGLDPKYNVRVDVRKSPDYKEIGSRDPVKWLSQYSIQPENLAGLQQVIQQSERNVDVIVIELPFYETAYEFFLNGKQDYDAYAQQVDLITTASRIPFLRLDEQPQLLPEEWWDYFHLNLRGAQSYSEWLGNKLADMYLQGELKLFSHDTP